MRHKILVLGAVVSLVVASACSSSSRDVHPIGTAPGPNPDVIPAIITPAYVDAVFKVLNRVYGEALREELTTRGVGPTVTTELQAIYIPPQLGVELAIFNQALNGSLRYVLPNPGDRVFTTTALQRATSSCIQAEEVADYTAVDRTKTAPQALTVVLARKHAGAHNSINATPWVISYEKTQSPATTCPT